MSTESRKKYQPPQVVSIYSALSAEGGSSPTGFCIDGSDPYTNTCATGINPTQDPLYCWPLGQFPTYAGCNDGNGAIEGCLAGSLVSPY